MCRRCRLWVRLGNASINWLMENLGPPYWAPLWDWTNGQWQTPHKHVFLPIALRELLRRIQVKNRVNTLRPIQNGRHFADDVFKCIFLNENVWIVLKISLNIVPWGPISNIPSLVRIMAWRRPGDKSLSEPMMVSLLTHICVARPQWVNFCKRYLICFITCRWLAANQNSNGKE